MEPTAVAYRWSDLEVDRPMDLIDRRRIMGIQMMVSHVTLHKGFHVPPHSHENEQIAMVMSGRMRFTIHRRENESAPPEELTLEAGDVLHLPSNVIHGAEALETSVVIDLFSPPSETTGVDRKD